MENYSTTFLKTDWSGAGLDFEFYLILSEKSIALTKMNKFIGKIAKDHMCCELYGSDPPSTYESIMFDVTEIQQRAKHLQPIFTSLPSRLFVWFEYGCSTELRFFIRAYQPDVLQIGAESSFYYSGYKNEDSMRVEVIIDFLNVAIAIFGKAIGAFAADGYVERIVSDMVKEKKLCNFIDPLDKEYWCDYVLKVCDDARKAETSD